ncbi:hypothetical protein DESUT3_39450 [Desulfuromonas versatilis]|uniref:Methyltransferase domain-containing protein n=1 Tax=Desulfuromonas versatilis TaxID=2802975 RepID=A0ABM8HVD4_9BACT|nr:class I SAM-dependent methyltransferase [Desulfuromonas versatilis]BCR06876.1 hypothetical protein DESUT3_39450 [Desulfuromonas versatilis]
MRKTPQDWNEKWREAADRPLAPDPWLLRVLPLLPRGAVLDLACGQGRNALLLAERGYQVTALDLSATGLERLREEAARRSLPIRVRQVDLEAEPRLGSARYAVVLDFFYLQRGLFPAIRQALRPGGVAVVRTFSKAGPFPGGPGNPDYVLEPGELLQLFAGWEILLHEEGLEPSSKGGSLAGIVARRPRGERS